MKFKHPQISFLSSCVTVYASKSVTIWFWVFVWTTKQKHEWVEVKQLNCATNLSIGGRDQANSSSLEGNG